MYKQGGMFRIITECVCYDNELKRPEDVSVEYTMPGTVSNIK